MSSARVPSRRPAPSAALAPLLAAVALLTAGCDQLGIEMPAAAAAKKEADGKAIGGACRHAGRAIEDCYALNRKADRAAVYAGWREMNEYMRENKLDPVEPKLPPPGAAASAPKPKKADPDADEPAEAGGDQHAKDGGADAKAH